MSFQIGILIFSRGSYFSYQYKWTELNPRGIVEYHLSIDTSAFYDSLQK